MNIKTLIEKLERLRERNGDNIEVRLGEYGGGSSQVNGSYYDDAEELIIIH
ncbi:hypothetical protein SAMN04489761_3439 [Tenacibaculum sp. MAR_2009_124]|uniref:hypothetical protein n=1 Tax=Tenacibaculum sp. MAR_2009_124 TaxID=1250059 RepID=UPI00089A89D5|nr:hypothetical protein [Tenacibaculum sp. MAR_2009_124]SEC66460.1 hypothetical protein SAMN04489761_3439 [Tenacibaculum sp. MAR_2009_124]